MRQQARSAAKGNGPAQRHFIDRVQAIEQEELQGGRSPASTGGLITAITGATNLDGSSPFLEPQHARGFLYSASDFGPRFRGLRSPTKSPNRALG